MIIKFLTKRSFWITGLLTLVCLSAAALSITLDSHATKATANKGVQWRCKRCGGFNYSETADWEGDYYCSRCGARKGDG